MPSLSHWFNSQFTHQLNSPIATSCIHCFSRSFVDSLGTFCTSINSHINIRFSKSVDMLVYTSLFVNIDNLPKPFLYSCLHINNISRSAHKNFNAVVRTQSSKFDEIEGSERDRKRMRPPLSRSPMLHTYKVVKTSHSGETVNRVFRVFGWRSVKSNMVNFELFKRV